MPDTQTEVLRCGYIDLTPSRTFRTDYITPEEMRDHMSNEFCGVENGQIENMYGTGVDVQRFSLGAKEGEGRIVYQPQILGKIPLLAEATLNLIVWAYDYKSGKHQPMRTGPEATNKGRFRAYLYTPTYQEDYMQRQQIRESGLDLFAGFIDRVRSNRQRTEVKLTPSW
jgi:hypothetical protein